MTTNSRFALGLAAGFLMTTAATASFGASDIAVSLWDTGENAMDMMDSMAPMGMAMDGDMAMVTMGIKVDTDKVPAGEVTFTATNDSDSIIHEMILAPVVSMEAPLPYDTDSMRVDEDAAKSLGEVSELEPGDSGALTVTLEPGTYILYCNIPGHYVMGMWTTIEVTP